MSIDPNNFEAQGSPTKEQARNVWDSLPQPSARKCADKLMNMGYAVSWRTIARWKARDWRDDEPNSKPLAEKGRVRGVAKELREELKRVSPATVAEADKIAAEGGLEAAMTGGKLKEDDYARLEKRINALSLKSRADLLVDQEKTRIVMNIVMMEEATRRSHVMVLIPKETGSFVKDTNEAADNTASVAPIEAMPPRNGDDAKVIEGKVNPPSALSLTINRILREAGDGAAA